MDIFSNTVCMSVSDSVVNRDDVVSAIVSTNPVRREAVGETLLMFICREKLAVVVAELLMNTGMSGSTGYMIPLNGSFSQGSRAPLYAMAYAVVKMS